MADRALATVEVVRDVQPIPDADNIVRAQVRDWDVVTRKGEFTPGQHCVYFEIDSMLPEDDPRFAFLMPRGVRTDVDGFRGHVLRTARLRGVYSQGLALPLNQFPEIGKGAVGQDVTDTLGIRKWDPPVPASLAGVVAGPFPSWIPKTDEERIQNAGWMLDQDQLQWYATEKIDGSSATYFMDVDGSFGACSRNLNLRDDGSNTFWNVAHNLDLPNVLRSYADETGLTRVAIQGEVFGEGIQKNPLRVKGQHFRLFALHHDGVRVSRVGWPEFALAMSVPLVQLPFPDSVKDALEQVDGMKSLISPDRPAEGVVWSVCDRTHVTTPRGDVRASFKAISNRYLAKAKD